MNCETFSPGNQRFTAHNFRLTGSDVESAGSKTSSSILVGPSAALIGWIPVYQNREQLPEGHLRDAWKEDSSIGRLLGTGNNPPQDAFTGPGDLIRYLNTREFRGAIAIDQPTIELDTDGQPISVRFFTLARVGGTPLRGKPGSLNLFMLLYEGGVASRSGDILHDSHEVMIRVWIRIKIGLLGQMVARWKTGVWPPWAGLHLDYVFGVGPGAPSARIVFRGTAVPSQSRYLSWKRQPEGYRIEYDMNSEAYERFLATGNCKDAPWESEWGADLTLAKMRIPAE